MPPVDSSLYGSGIVRANITDTQMANNGVPMDIGYLNYVANMSPEQTLMMYEGNPNIQQVVVYDAASGAKMFKMMDISTGQVIENVPTYDEFIYMPKNVLDIVIYTSTYKNVKTYTDFSKFKYDKDVGAYSVVNLDSHTTENILEKNDTKYEIIRIIYMILTIILAPCALIIYLINIKRKDIYNIITSIILFIYLIILACVSYTDATAFPTMRYLCLGNLYILQTIFIMLNVYRFYNRKNN
jgi:hypothetical protein